MSETNNLIRVIAVIFLLAAPALSIRFVSEYFDAPHLQPLDLTRESIAAVDQGPEGLEFARIDVHVGWGREWDGALTPAQLQEAIAKSLEAQTKYYHIKVQEVPGREIGVTFDVGYNSYGPFAPGQIAGGIKSALLALRMTNGPEQ